MRPSEQVFAAIRDNHVITLKSLIAADPMLLAARDERGSTPLVLATYLDNLPATMTLVDAGAELNVADARGNTPLMGAAFKGHAGIVAYLLDQGADAGVRSADGQTAMDFAKLFRHAAIVQLLENG